MGYHVNFEFLDEEAIENAITCLNYRMDKVIFFGEKELIKTKKAALRLFLTETCEVGKKAQLSAREAVRFIEISETDLNDVLGKMRDAIEAEAKEASHRFIDVTGGEGLALLAFGILAKELNLPMHLYDVETGALNEYLSDDSNSISKNGKKKKIPWNVETFVKMQGGDVLDTGWGTKVIYSEEDLADIDKMWKLMNQYKTYWNGFCGVLARFHSSQNVINSAKDALVFEGRVEDVKKVLREESGYYSQFRERNNSGMKNRKESKDEREAREERELKRAYDKLNEMIKACKEKELLSEFAYTAYGYRYEFKNEFIAICLKKAGNILEQHVYKKVKEQCPDVIDHQVGVQIDWDIIDTCKFTEVSNEIDVLGLKGYVPVFISCKAERIDRVDQDVLYELDVVARRLGGKYAKKVLAVTEMWRGRHRNRADEMGIEVWEEVE